MKVEDLSADQLQDYFAEHVRYEVQMLLYATMAISKKLSVPRWLVHMPVESYAIHLRNLITFFYPLFYRDTDICARNFFTKEEEWLEIRPELSEVLEIAKVRADKEVGHLTTSRQSGTPPSKFWDVEGLTSEIMPIFKLFGESANKVDLKPLVKDVLDHYLYIQNA